MKCSAEEKGGDRCWRGCVMPHECLGLMRPDALERSIHCLACGAVMTAGKLIAADRLRCPHCRSDQVKYLTAAVPSTHQ